MVREFRVVLNPSVMGLMADGAVRDSARRMLRRLHTPQASNPFH